MKYLSVKLDQTTELTFDNSIWGKEIIRINGEQVSENTSVWGSVHEFERLEDNIRSKYTVEIKMNILAQIKYRISRNNEILVNDFDKKPSVKDINKRTIFFIIWLGLMIFTVIKGSSIIFPLLAVPLLLGGSFTAPTHRQIDLTTSKSI